MAIVRTHLAMIEGLKAEGMTWVAIAAALTRQGVKQRNGKPLTGRRLTGLIHSIRRQEAGRQKASVRRASRADLVTEPLAMSRPRPSKTSSPVPSRSAEAPHGEAETPAEVRRSAEQIRREGLADLYDMLKGKKP